MLHNGGVRIIERPGVALNVLHVVLECGNASVKSIFKSGFDSAEIDRVGNNQCVDRESIEINRHCEALGYAESHNLLEAGDNSFTLGVATSSWPFTGLGIITQSFNFVCGNWNTGTEPRWQSCDMSSTIPT
jgi:hypothetical protein